MTAKHSNPTRPEVDKQNARTQWAHAPYNFVPLPEQIMTAQSPFEHDQYQGLTGWIECQLETCSPLYVRGMLTVAQFKEYGHASELTVGQKQRAQSPPGCHYKLVACITVALQAGSLQGHCLTCKLYPDLSQ